MKATERRLPKTCGPWSQGGTRTVHVELSTVVVSGLHQAVANESALQLEALKARCEELERRNAPAAPASALATSPSSKIASALETSNTGTAFGSSATTEDFASPEGRLLHDPDGTARYLGPSSGAHFLNRVKEFMATIQPLVGVQQGYPPHSGQAFLTSVGRYQTFDSRTLQLLPVDPLQLPSQTEMTLMVTEFRFFTQDGNGDFPSGGIFYWGNLSFANQFPYDAAALRNSGQLVLLHMILAVAARLGSAANWKDEDCSERFFSRAQQMLGNPLDITSHTSRDTSVMLLMAFYLIEANRRDAAYVMVSVALHLAVMDGAHCSYGQGEDLKRTFWTFGFPSPVGLRAHIDLAKISRYIVCNVYRIAPSDQSSTTSLQHVEHALSLLQQWLASLPPPLQINGQRLTKDRACLVLHLIYHQDIILTTRPIFFAATKKILADRFLSQKAHKDRAGNYQGGLYMSCVGHCLDAARENIRLGRLIRDASPRQRLTHQEAHAVFNAALIILMQQLASPQSDSAETDDVAFAIEVFQQEARLGNNFGLDCLTVLQDLSFIAHALPQTQVSVAEEQIISAVTYTASSEANVQAESAIPAPDVDLLESSCDGQAGVELNGALFKELQTWLENDYLEIYNDFRL
ncbi:fungal specific transcription factor domain-containing protein [Trichoderma harzianum]|uniref:Fungal specific transcription factor domain-containing protein n=1 Tax=Trichoderma harzianum TaxID=5544 RepID=A0A0F9ZS37_TRIHA|nr:fungal specific transcription factor domain-containing protein [Trichoderma harzianum]